MGTRGNLSAPICIVGESAGADEDACGLPFVGSSGREQDRMLADAGITQNNCWLTNPYKTRPPDNKIDRLLELGIPLGTFQAQFFEELEQYKPTVIIACGKTVTNLLCPFTIPKKRGSRSEEDTKADGFGKFRGSLLTSPSLSWPHYILPIYHPAFVLRNWAERQTSVLIYSKGREEADYFQKHGRLQELPTRNLRDDPSYDEIVEYLTTAGNQPDPVSLDIELLWSSKLKVKFIDILGIAKSPTDALAFNPFDFPGDRLAKLMRLYDNILQNKVIIGQNFTTFDAHWLRTIGCQTTIRNVHDTLIRHHTLYPELEHSLAFMTLQYTREPYYKDEGHTYNKKNKRRYCCKDNAVTYEVFNAQEKEFEAQCQLAMKPELVGDAMVHER